MIQRRMKFWLCTAAAGAVAASLTGAPAQAQAAGAADEGSQLEEVVVTARRTSERNQSVPVAVTALAGDQLARLNVTQSSELQRIAPSLTVSTTIRGSDTPQYGIRAQRAGTPTMLIDPAVGVYFAEVGTSRSGGGDAILHDIDSIQILRGPQGTLFGRNTTGGAVLITPREPTPEVEGYAQLRLGDFNLRDLEGALNLPVTDSVAVRFAAKTTQRDGYFHNRHLGTESNDINSQSYRLSLAVEPSDRLHSTTIVSYQSSDNHGAALKLKVVDPTVYAGATLALAPLLNADLAAQPSGFYDYNNASPGLSRQQIYGIQNTTRLDLNDTWTLKNIIGYRRYDVDYCINLNGSVVQVLDYCGIQYTTQFSDELQLMGKVGGLELIGGLFYFREEGQEVNQQQQLKALAGLTPTNSPAPANINYADSEPTNTSYSVFAHANYDLSAVREGLSVSAGVRFTWDEREVVWHNRNEVRITPGTNDRAFRCLLSDTTGGAVNFPTAARNLCNYKASADFSEPTWDISLNYQASPNLLVYAAHRHGYRAGGFNSSPTSTALAAPFEPEKIDDIEVGFKSDFRIADRPARFNVALYHSWYKQIQRNTSRPFQLQPPPAAPTVAVTTTNASDGVIYGGEFEFTWLPAPGLELKLNYARTNTEYKTFTDTYLVNGALTAVDISDAPFTFAPENQVNAAIRYDIPIADGLGQPSITLSYYSQSSFATQDGATRNCGPNGLYRNCLTAPATLPGFSLVNLQGAWTNVMGKGFDAGVFASNLLDEEYYTYAVSMQNSFGTYAAGVGAPRMIGVYVKMPFGAAAY